MKFELPRSEEPDTVRPNVEPRVIAQIQHDLKDLFRNAKDPVGVLLQTMDSEEFSRVVPAVIADPVRIKLRAIASVPFKNAEEFAQRVSEIALPVLEITKRGKKDAYKQEGREMYSEEDMTRTVELIRSRDSKKIFIVGNVGSGKTTFARELSRSIGASNIDVDAFFPVFRQEFGREAADIHELKQFILQRVEPPFVLNHADLLRMGMTGDADMVIYLNPKREEQIVSRAMREERGAEGEWQGVREEDYADIIARNTASFEALDGEILYANMATGRSIKAIKPAERYAHSRP